MGYVLVFDILNSNSWGLPQSRRRFLGCLSSFRAFGEIAIRVGRRGNADFCPSKGDASRALSSRLAVYLGEIRDCNEGERLRQGLKVCAETWGVC